MRQKVLAWFVHSRWEWGPASLNNKKKKRSSQPWKSAEDKNEENAMEIAATWQSGRKFVS